MCLITAPSGTPPSYPALYPSLRPSLPAVGLSVAALAGEEMLGHLAGDAPVALARAALGRVWVRVQG